jgi:hypothetical protein
MSGPSDLARLTTTIDAANELLLSDEIKMMDVGDGVQRPTNAKVLADLSTQMSGALIYTTAALGLAGTVAGGYFSVISPENDQYLILYKNEAGAAVEKDRYPNAVATKRASETADMALQLANPRSLSDVMPWAVVDQFYRAILGVKSSGVAHAVLDRLPGLDLLGEFSWAVTDTTGVVLLGIKWSGEVVVYGQSVGEVTAYADGPVGGQDIFVLVNGAPYQLTSNGDSFSPKVSDGRVSFVRRAGPVNSVNMDIPLPGSVAAFITQILHIVSSGQSLSMGSGSTLTTMQPPVANRLLTIQDGVRLANQDDTLTSGMIAPFKALVGKTQEVPVVQMAAQINRLRGIPSNAGVLATAHGRGGWSIAQLSKGTLPYTNSITAVTGAKAQCAVLSYNYKVPFVDWIQGEADAAAIPGAYLAGLLQLQSDYESDIKAISGQTGRIPLLLDQISNWTAPGYNRTQSNVPLEQLQVALDYPDRFVCAGPKYWLQTISDGVHLTGDSSMRLGAMHARAAQAIIGGQSWLPTHCLSAVLIGQKVTLKFHTPHGPLVSDTLNVTDPGNWGIRWIDSSLSAAVSSVKLLGANSVEVILSAVPTGANPQIGIADVGVSGMLAGPTTGVRACLRDSSPDLDTNGQPVFNWACHQRIAVSTSN